MRKKKIEADLEEIRVETSLVWEATGVIIFLIVAGVVFYKILKS